jgi:hypothetical protein
VGDRVGDRVGKVPQMVKPALMMLPSEYHWMMEFAGTATPFGVLVAPLYRMLLTVT